MFHKKREPMIEEECVGVSEKVTDSRRIEWGDRVRNDRH